MSVKASDIRKDVQEYIRANFLFDPSRALDDEESLLGAGIIDSTGVLELIGHLEAKYGMKFADDDLTADHFDSVQRISEFMEKKLAA